jgi:hypothetical protein
MSPASTVVRGGGRAPASKDSHLCWHKIAGGCCARQHKGVLAASKNRFWPSEQNCSCCHLLHLFEIVGRLTFNSKFDIYLIQKIMHNVIFLSWLTLLINVLKKL